MSQTAFERMGRSDFSLEAFLDARRLAWDAVNRVASQVRPGMNEPEIQSLLTAALQQEGLEKPWHRPVVRVGGDTVKAFSPLSDPALRLDANDIFFLDIGPVWKGYEADVGETFVLGGDPEMIRCAADCRKLFDIVRDEWRKSGRSGQALYDFAAEATEALGWEFVAETNGHRLGDFPHHAHFRGGMGTVDFRPSSAVWVLEIQIRHKNRAFGAFYEDLLVD